MKCVFSTMFNRAYNILTSGKYPLQTPQHNVRFFETGILRAQNENFPCFKIGTSLVDQNGRNIYVQRYTNELSQKHIPVLALLEAKSQKSKPWYLFSHSDYSTDTFRRLANPQSTPHRGTGMPEQDLSKGAYYVNDETMFTDFVDLALWRKDTLKYIRDAIKSFID